MMCPSAEEKDSLSISEDVVAEAKKRRKMAPYPPVRNVSCEYDEGVLFLRGEVPHSLRSSLRRNPPRLGTSKPCAPMP